MERHFDKARPIIPYEIYYCQSATAKWSTIVSLMVEPYNAFTRSLDWERMEDTITIMVGEDFTIMEEEEEEEEEDEEEEKGDISAGLGFGSERVKWVKHYSSSHRILLVGEGDFSFALCLATAFGTSTNMVATSLDTQDGLASKYSYGIGNVRELEERGCLILHGVDATKMSQHFFLRTQRFDRIVYNFPHVGFLYREASYCQIQLNKKLVKGFLENAQVLLKERGEVHVSHKMGEPYNKWDLVKKAKKRGLLLHEAVPFCKEDYPGYGNKRAHGSLSDAPFRLGECTTFKFILNTQTQKKQR